MQNDQKIYEEIAKLLVSRAPQDAYVLKFKFSIYPDDNGGDWGYARFMFDYINSFGEENWYEVKETPVKTALSKLCSELRKIMQEISGDLWHEMEFTVNLREARFKAEFNYDKPISNGIE